MKLTKTEKSKNNGQGYGTSNDCLNTSRYNESGGKRVVDQSCSQKYISKSGKAMTTDEYREGYTEAISDLYRGFYEEWVSKEGDYVIMINKILNLQQENARLKKKLDYFIKEDIKNRQETIKRLEWLKKQELSALEYPYKLSCSKCKKEIVIFYGNKKDGYLCKYCKIDQAKTLPIEKIEEELK